MKECEVCKRRLYFWNRYHRDYPAIEFNLSGKSKDINFCSSECSNKYIDKLLRRKRK